MRPLPTGTVTFMFTDIEGSTRLLAEVGREIFGEMLDDHSALIRGALADSNGFEVGTEGDSFFAVFTNAVDAVAAAVDAQRSLQGHRWPGDTSLRVRMGLHTGTGVLGGADYVGIDVNRAARITDVGHGGQVLVSETTAELVGGDLPPDVGLADLGRHGLKDLAPEHLFQLTIDGLTGDFPPLRSSSPWTTNLPTALTSFIGREGEITHVAQLLTDHRLLTLTGPGGTGKTRLAIEVARSLLDSFEDGVFFVPLAEIRDPDQIPARILEALDLRTNSAELAPIDHLSSYLATRELLLVLDNFEQVAPGASIVAHLLQAGPRLKVMATSRVSLRLGGEQEFPVPPLATSTAEAPVESESVQLFVERATSVHPDLQMAGPALQTISELTNRLEGLPLAIELAASRTKVLTPESILGRLDNRLLASSGTDLPSRQQTIVDTISWSYDLLDEPAQLVFEQISAFSGGAYLDQILSVCHLPEADDFELVEYVEHLVDHSLMRRTSDSRFAMLNVIREFAYGALVARGADSKIQERHAAAYEELVAVAQPNLLTGARRRWLDRLGEDHDNIRSALNWSIRKEETDTALNIAAGMWRYWQTRGPLPEAMEMVTQALGMPGGDPRARARALGAAGGIAYWRGDLAATMEPYGEAVDLMREYGEEQELAEALYNLSWAFIGQEDFDRAGAAVDESMEISQQINDPHGIARAHWGRFDLAWYEGRLEEALEHAKLSVEGFEKLDAGFDLGWAYFAVADMQMKLGDLDEARHYFHLGLPGFLEARDLSALVLFLSDYAALEMLQGNRARAARLLGAAEALKEQTGVLLFEATAWDKPNKDVRELLGQVDETVVTELEEGRRMTAEQAVAFVFESGSSSPG